MARLVGLGSLCALGSAWLLLTGQPVGGPNQKAPYWDGYAASVAASVEADCLPPAPKPDAPDTGGARGAVFGGPLDTLRGMGQLVDRGNQIAAKTDAVLEATKAAAKTFSDELQRRTPAEATPPVGWTCGPDGCVYAGRSPATTPEATAAAATRHVATWATCGRRPLLPRRWRR